MTVSGINVSSCCGEQEFSAAVRPSAGARELGGDGTVRQHRTTRGTACELSTKIKSEGVVGVIFAV